VDDCQICRNDVKLFMGAGQGRKDQGGRGRKTKKIASRESTSRAVFAKPEVKGR